MLQRSSAPAATIINAHSKKKKPTFKQVGSDVYNGITNFASFTGLDKTFNQIQNHPATSHLKNAVHSVAKSASVLATNTPPGQIAKAVGISPAHVYDKLTTVQTGKGRTKTHRRRKRKHNKTKKTRKHRKHRKTIKTIKTRKRKTLNKKRKYKNKKKHNTRKINKRKINKRK